MDRVCLPAASLEIHQGKNFGQKDSPEPGEQTVSQRLQEIFCNVVLTDFTGDLTISMLGSEQNPSMLSYPVPPQAWLLDQS